MTSDDHDDADGRQAPVEIPEAPVAGGLDPEDLEPDDPGIADAERAAERLGPEIPTPPEPGEGDPEVVGLFWKLVVVFNVALLGVTVGPMIGYFAGDWDLGLRVFAVGALALAYGLVRYYQYRRDRESDADDPREA